MNFPGSSHRKRWLERGGNDDAADSLSNRKKLQNAEPSEPEERRRKALVVRGCLGKVQIIGSNLNYSQNLRLTAMAYIKRYFEVEPLQGNDMAVMVLTAYYLAGKVEEEIGNGMQMDKRGVNMKDLCEFVKNKKRSADEFKTAAIRNEMRLLAGLNFDLLCFHPLRSALALWNQLRSKVPDEKQFEGLKKAIALRCEGCYLVDDLVFRYPHSFLGAVVVLASIKSAAFEDSIKHDLARELNVQLKELLNGKGKDSMGDLHLEAVASALEAGLAQAKSKEADEAYMDYIKRGTLSPPS